MQEHAQALRRVDGNNLILCTAFRAQSLMIRPSCCRFSLFRTGKSYKTMQFVRASLVSTAQRYLCWSRKNQRPCLFKMLARNFNTRIGKNFVNHSMANICSGREKERSERWLTHLAFHRQNSHPICVRKTFFHSCTLKRRKCENCG